MSTSILLLLSSVVIGFLTYGISRKQIRKLKKRVQELEVEMLENHREILQLEGHLVKRPSEALVATPVITMPASKAVKSQ